MSKTIPCLILKCWRDIVISGNVPFTSSNNENIRLLSDAIIGIFNQLFLFLLEIYLMYICYTILAMYDDYNEILYRFQTLHNVENCCCLHHYLVKTLM